MTSRYDTDQHQESIEAYEVAETSAAKAEADVDQQVRNGITSIHDSIEGLRKEIGDVLRCPSSPCDSGGDPCGVGELARVLADGLYRAGVTGANVYEHARLAAERLRAFARDNGFDHRDAEAQMVEAIRALPAEGSASGYADAVYTAMKRLVLEPGRLLPHRLNALEDARRILAAAGTSSERPPGPPPLASSEVLRDVSHLTTLLLGSSPAFADAMRMQSDAIAYSLAAFNKVGDMQRQDALGLAIAARSAAAQLDRR